MALNEYEIKKMICDVGKRIYDRNMVAANDAICDVKQQIEIAKELPNLVDYHLFQKSGHNILNDCEYKDAMARVKMWLRA